MRRLASVLTMFALPLYAACSADATTQNPQSDAGGGGVGALDGGGGAGGSSGAGGANRGDASTMTGDTSGPSTDAHSETGPDAMASCTTTTCDDGTCVDQHIAFDGCGCMKTYCSDALCVRGACAGELAMDLPHVGPPLAIDGSSAYGLAFGNNQVQLYRIDDDATASVMVSKLDVDFLEMSRPVIDATYVYFVIDTNTGRHVYRTPKAGGAYQEIGQEGTTYTNDIDIAVDQTNVYWRGENGIFRVPLAGGQVLHWQHIACGFDITVADGWAYFSCDSSMYRRLTSEPDEVDSLNLVPFDSGGFQPDSVTYWTGYPFVAADHLYYLNGTTIESASLVNDDKASYVLPNFFALFDFWIDGERLFATVAMDDQNRTSFLVEFPKLGDPTYTVVADLASNVGRIDGFTPKWLYLHPYSEIMRIPRP